MPTLTLNSTGPTPETLEVSKNDRSVTIVNNLGAEVTLSLNPSGFLNPSAGDTLAVPVAGQDVTAGSSGTYEYSDPTSNQRASRTGRINVG